MKTNYKNETPPPPPRVHYGALESPERTFSIAHGETAAFFSYLFLKFHAQNHKLQKHASPEQLYQQGMSSCALYQRSSAAEVILLLLSLQKKRSRWPDSLSSGCSHWHSVGMKIPLQTFIKQWTLCSAEGSMWIYKGNT